jgi:hypothetical protein
MSSYCSIYLYVLQDSSYYSRPFEITYTYQRPSPLRPHYHLPTFIYLCVHLSSTYRPHLPSTYRPLRWPIDLHLPLRPPIDLYVHLWTSLYLYVPLSTSTSSYQPLLMSTFSYRPTSTSFYRLRSPLNLYLRLRPPIDVFRPLRPLYVPFTSSYRPLFTSRTSSLSTDLPLRPPMSTSLYLYLLLLWINISTSTSSYLSLNLTYRPPFDLQVLLLIWPRCPSFLK